VHFAPGKGAAVAGSTLHGVPSLLWEGRWAWRFGLVWLARIAQRLRPDVVHTHQVLPAGYAAALARLSPHVATAWGSEVLLASKPRQRRAIRRVAQHADLLTADSTHLLEALRALGARQERLRLVPWGVDPDWATAAKGLPPRVAAAQAGLPPERPIVLSPRGTVEVYRPELVLRALALAVQGTPDLLGVVAYDMAANVIPLGVLEKLASDLGLSSNVIFHPKWPHEEMPFVYRAAKVCVSVPESDSAPISVIEALALGTPAIVSDLPWVHEEPYREAELDVVPRDDAGALAEAITRSLAANGHGASEANQRLVAERFDRRALFKEMESEYERLAGHSG